MTVQTNKKIIVMLKRLFSAIIAVASCISAGAQGTCIINGNITDGKKIKKVSLVIADEFGQEREVAVSKVKKGKYLFTHEIAAGEPVMLYTIKGIGEKGIRLFVEPGEVNVNTVSAEAPEESTVTGTPTNDAYAEYMAIRDAGQKRVETQTEALAAANGSDWLQSNEGQNAVKSIKAKEAIKTEAEAIRFLINHNSSPMTPFEIEHTLLPNLSEGYADQMTKAIAVSLGNHPYYLSLRNKVLSNSMKVGNEVPDITLPLLSDEKKRLSDYRGKYVVLNFWASGCEKSPAMLAIMKELYETIKSSNDQFVIVSFALDSNAAAWKDAVKSNGTDLEGWIHACDVAGADSPAAKLYKVESTPKIVLIEPEGRAVSLNLENNEVIMRVKQIMSGDLYYLDQEE